MISTNTADQTVSTDASKRQLRNQHKHALGDPHHKPKRAKNPRYFNEWNGEDRVKYNQTTIFLRLAKATQRQCQYERLKSSSDATRKVGLWTKIKMIFGTSPTYRKEMLDFRKLKQHYKPVPKDISVDLPPFQ